MRNEGSRTEAGLTRSKCGYRTCIRTSGLFCRFGTKHLVNQARLGVAFDAAPILTGLFTR